MKNILCFGDSNTFGLNPDGSGRYDFSVRYPGKLQSILGSDYHIIEEGCPGRTTIFEDRNRPYKRAIDYISPCLLSHTPIDYVLVMLGTNDCKTAFGASAGDIAAGLSAVLARILQEVLPVPKVLIISPIHLGSNIVTLGLDPDFDQSSIDVSTRLSDEYHLLAQNSGCGFLDAATVARASRLDEQHLDEAGHSSLAGAAAEIILAGI